MRKKFLAIALALCMVFTMLPMAAMAASFDDVADDHWAASSIDRWAGYGVLGGHGDGTFTPDKSMTRAEFASMLVKMLGLTAKSDKVFTDVEADAWYADVISVAVAAGIINGKSPDAFAPNDPVSFEEAAVTADKESSVADVTVSGTAPAVAIEGQVKGDVSISGETAKVELNGEVAGSVTVEETATGAEIKGDGVTADKVTNNSAEDVKVNDETVEAKPDGTQKPDDDKKPTTPSTGDNTGDDNTGDTGDAGGSTGGNQGGTTEPSKPEIKDPEIEQPKPSDPTQDKPADPSDDDIKTDGEDYDTEAAKKCETDGHNWGAVTETKAGTCKAFGEGTRSCSVCHATQSVQTAKGAHVAGDAAVETAGDCVTKAVMVTKCSVCQEVLSRAAGEANPDNHKSVEDIPAVAPTCGKDGTTAGKRCTACNTVTVEPEKDPATGKHTYENGERKTCGAKMSDEDKAKCDHSSLKGGETCSTCGQTVELTTSNCPKADSHATMKKGETCDCGYEGNVEDTREPENPGTGGGEDNTQGET